MVLAVEVIERKLLESLLVVMQGGYFLFAPNPTCKVGSTESCTTKPLCSESHGALCLEWGLTEVPLQKSDLNLFPAPVGVCKQALVWSNTWEDKLRDFSHISLSSQDELWGTQYASHFIQWEFHPACVGTILWFVSLKEHKSTFALRPFSGGLRGGAGQPAHIPQGLASFNLPFWVFVCLSIFLFTFLCVLNPQSLLLWLLFEPLCTHSHRGPILQPLSLVKGL